MPTSPAAPRGRTAYSRNVPRVASLSPRSGRAPSASCVRCACGTGGGGGGGGGGRPSSTAGRRRSSVGLPRTSSAHSRGGYGHGGDSVGGASVGNPAWVQPTTTVTSVPIRTVGRNRAIDPEWALPNMTDRHSTAAYPNWTLADTEQKARQLPPNEKPPPANVGLASPRRAEKRELTSAMRSYPNWTLPDGDTAGGGSGSLSAAESARRRAASPGSTRRSFHDNNDIEGSRPALRRFGKAGQRIVADPYPGSNCYPAEVGWNRERTNTVTPWREVENRAPGRSQTPRGRAAEHGRAALYDHEQGTLRTKEVEVFSNGRYATTEVLTRRRVEESSLGAPVPDSHPRHTVGVGRASPRHGRASSSLHTADIEGAQPRTYSVTPTRARHERSVTPVRARGGGGGGDTRPGTPVSQRFDSPRVQRQQQQQQQQQAPRAMSPGASARQSASQNHYTQMQSQVTFF